MVKKISLLIIFYFLTSCGVCINNLTLSNIKDFNTDALKGIYLNQDYICTGVYFSDKNFNIKRTASDYCSQRILIKNNGYIESHIVSTNKQGYSGVIYIKNNKLKIDLIGGTDDRCKIINTYLVKISEDKIYLLEQGNNIEKLYYVFKLKK